MVRIYLALNEINNVLDNVEDLGGKIVKNAATNLWGNLRQESPLDHGRLRGSWSIFEDGPEQRTVKSSANYAEYLSRGTGVYGPYKTPIVHPTIGKKFAFQVNGKMVYTNIIQGIKPNPYVEISMERTQNRIPEIVIQSINQAKLG